MSGLQYDYRRTVRNEDLELSGVFFGEWGTIDVAFDGQIVDHPGIDKITPRLRRLVDDAVARWKAER